MKILVAALILLCVFNLNAVSQTASDAKSERTLTVQVQTPDGKPLPNVTVVCVDASTNAILKGTIIEGGSERFQTDAAGRFTFNLQNENLFLMLATDTGFGLAQSRDLTNNPALLVLAWGRIEGVRMNLGQPMNNQKLAVFIDGECLGGATNHLDRVGISAETMTDSQGKFTFDRIPPVGFRLCEIRDHPKGVWDALKHFSVEPGETKKLTIATQGRTVIGKFDLNGLITNEVDLQSYEGWFSPVSAHHGTVPDLPKEFDTPDKRTKWWEDWYGSDEGRQIFVPADEQGSRFDFQTNGTFFAEMAAPGRYWVYANVRQNGKIVARTHEISVVIPATKTNSENEPFDVGTIPMRRPVSVGDVASDFSVKTLDGQPLKLSDFRRKYVLLDFWATWCVPCVAETPNLQATYDAFGQDNRFIIISLSLDADQAAPRKFVRSKDILWTQAFLGDWQQDRVTKDFEIGSIPSIWLIGPDGKIISRNLRGPKIKETVAAALSSR